MARTEHVTVTLDKDALASARREARARKMSLSALISEALAQTAKYRAFRAWMDVTYEGRPITQAELDEADRTLAALWEKPTASGRRRRAQPTKRTAAKRPRT